MMNGGKIRILHVVALGVAFLLARAVTAAEAPYCDLNDIKGIGARRAAAKAQAELEARGIGKMPITTRKLDEAERNLDKLGEARVEKISNTPDEVLRFRGAVGDAKAEAGVVAKEAETAAKPAVSAAEKAPAPKSQYVPPEIRGHEKDYERLTGNYYDLENGSVLEGSVKDGHLQPDYLIDFNAPAFKPLRDFAHDVKAMNVPTAEKIELVRKFIHGKELTHSSYTNPEYRALLAKYRDAGRDVPLSQYVACKAGVCRENALFMHMALKEAGIPNSYVYAKVRQAVFEGGKKTFDETEDHAFTILNIDGKRWIADSYNSNFHGYNFDQLSDPYLKRGTTLEHLPGAVEQDKGVLRQIVAINDYPVVWKPKTEEAAARGAQAFRDSELKNPPKPVYTDGTYLGEKKNARIGVFSGTFDPPHAGHMEAIQKALSEGKLDEIYIYVNRDPSHKPDATAFALRQKMAELAFAGDPRVKFVDPAKVREGTASQFLERMAAGNRHHLYYGIYGDDIIASPKFRPGTASNIRYIVAGRGSDTEMVESAIKARFGESLKANPDLVTRLESFDASSSNLKARIIRGEQPPEMFPAVAKFAEENKIYNEPKGERKLASVGAETQARYSLVETDDSGLKARLEKAIGQHFDLGVAPAIKGEARLPTRYESLERLNKTAQLWNDVRPGPDFRAALDKVIATGQSSKEFDKQVEELRSRIKTIRFLCESLCRDEAHLKDLNALGTALGGLQDAAKPGFGSKRQITAAAKTLKSELSVEKLVNIDHKLAILQPVTEKELGERMAENVKSIRKAIDAKDVSEADFHNVRLKIGNMQAVVLTGALTDESKKAEKSEKAAYEKFRDIFGKLGEVHDDLVKAQLHDAAVGRVTFTDGQKSEIEKVLGYFEKNRAVARSLETSDKELGLSEQIHALIENGSKTGLQPRLGGVPHLPKRSETEARMAEIGKLWEETRPRDSLRRELEEVVKNKGRYSPQLRAELKEARSFYKVIRFFCDALCTEDSKLKQFDKLTKALGTVNDIMGLDVKNELGHAQKVLGKNIDKPEEALVAAIENALKEMKPKKLDLVDIEMAKMTPLTASELAPEIEKDIKGIRKALYSESIEEKQFHDVRKALGRMQTIVLSNAFSEDGTKQEKASFTAFRKLYDEIGDIHDEMVNGSRPEEYTFTNKQRGGIERLIGYFEQSDRIEPGKLPKAAEKFVDRNARYSLVDTDAGLAADRGQALSALRGSYAAKMTPADAAAVTEKLTRRLEGYDPLYVKAAIEGSANGRRDVEEIAEFTSQVSANMTRAGASRELIAATIAGGVGGPRSAEEAANFARILNDDLRYEGYDKRTIAAAVQGSVGGKFEPEEAVAFTRNLAADLKIDGFDDQHVNAVLRGGADGNLTAKQASEFSRELSAQLKDAGVPRDIALAAVEGSLGKHLLPTEARVLTKDLIGKLTQQGYDHDTIVAAVAGGAGNYASADRTVAYVRELAGSPRATEPGRSLASIGAAKDASSARYSRVDTDADLAADRAPAAKPAEIKAPAAVRTVSDARLDGAMVMSTESIEKDPFTLAQLRMTGAMSASGPLGWDSPANVLGPTGWFGPSALISSFDWSKDAKKMVDGPLLSENGVFSARGPVGRAYENPAFAAYREDGPLLVLGPKGPLGPYGALGPLGEDGATGYKLDPKTGAFVHDGKVVTEAQVREGSGLVMRDLVEHYKPEYARSLSEKGELGGSFKMDDTIYPGQSRELNVNVKAGTVQTFAVSSEDGVFGRAGLRLLDENGTVLAKAESHENVNFVSLRVPHDTTVKVEITNFSGVPYYAANPFDVRNNLVTLHSTQAPVDSALHDFNKSYFSMLKGPESRSIASVADANQARYSRVETDRRKTLAGIDTRTSQFAQRQAAYGVDVKAVPQAAYRSMFSKEKWFREKQAVFTAIESDKENTSFKNLAETANRGDSSRVKTSVLVETAVTKDLNDVVVKDKDLVTALMNTHKDVLWTAIQRDELLSKHLIAKYTDFKSMKFAFDSDDPAVARRLKEIHADVNRRYAEFVSSEAEKQGWGDKATGLAAEVANWNHMGIGGTPDEANWAARQSRTMLDNGLSRARAFSDPEVKAAVERDLAEVAKLRRDAVARFAGVEGTTVEEAGQRVLSAEAIETIRKAKATEDSEAARSAAVKKALKERFDHDFSDSDVKAARDYAAKVDVFSPDLYITKTEKIGMEHHTNGVISVDFKGQNARNIEETMKALARTEGDKSTRAQMLAIRAGEEKATAELDRRKAEVSAALLELTKRISKSGDDMHGLLEEMVASDGKHWFAHRAGPSEVRTVFSPSFYADTGTKIPGELMQEYMGRGEEIEKSLSKAMYGAFPGERKMLNRAQIVIDMEPDSKGNHAMNVLVGGEVSASDRQKIANWASGYLAEKGVRSDFARALDGRPADVAGSFQHAKPVSMDKYVPPSVVGHEKDFVKTNERFRDVPNGAVVEGSVKFGKLQPDYIINYDAPEFAKLREFSRGLRATNLAEEDKANLVKDFIRGELLTNHRYDDPRYRQLIQKYRDAGKDVPISEYAACKAGVCRENAIYLHLALKDAGVPNDFVYARVRETWPEANGGKHDVTEDHAFVVYQARGKRWIADSYDSNFHGFSFDQLSRPSLAPNAQLEHLASAKVRPDVYRKIVELNDYPVIWKPNTGTEAKIDSISPKLVEALHGSPSKLEARLNEAISELPAYSGGSEEKQLERALKESFPGRKVTLAVPSDPGKSGDTVWMVFENGKPVSALKIYRRQPPVDFAMEVESLKTIGNPSSRVSFSAPNLEGAFSLESGGHRNPALIVSAANGHDVSSLFRRLLESPAQTDRKQVEGISRAVAGGLGALHREFADTKPTAEMLEEFKAYQVNQARKELEETFGSGAFERKGWITGAERAALQDKINSLINDYEKDDISSRASFMHGDFHSGNVFVDGENKPTFIDTGSAAYMIYRDRDGAPLFVGDPYADVGRFLESVSNDSVADKGRAARGQATMEKSFLEEYTKVTGAKLPNMQKALDFYRFQYDQKYFTAKFGNSEDQQRKILGHVLERLGIRQAVAGPAVVAREVPLYSSKSLPELRLTRPAVANAVLYREAATGELAAARHSYFNGKSSLKQLDAVNAKYGYLETPVTGAGERARRVGYLAQEENYLSRLADQARVDGDPAKAKRLERERAAVSAQLLAEQDNPAKVTSASRRGAVEALASDDNFARYSNGRTFADVTSDAEDAAFLRAQRDHDARALASNVAEARKAVSKALSDDDTRAEKLTNDLISVRASGDADPAKFRAKGWTDDEVSRCREAGLCTAWKPVADEPITMAASTRGILYEGELATGQAADEALAVAKPPSHAHTDVDSLLADLRASKDSVKGDSEEASRATALADERIKTLSQERGTLKDAHPLTHDDAKLNDKATAATVAFLGHADESTLSKLGLHDLPKGGDSSEGRLKTYEAFRARVADMGPKERAAVFSAVRESAANGTGELAVALKQASAPKEVEFAKAVERADAVASAAGEKDPALTRAIYRDEKLSKGDQALADAIGAAKASPKSSFERHAEEAAASKKLAARGPASEAHATFRAKAEADLKGATGLKEQERKELLASLEKQAKSDPEKARAALAHLQALSSNPDMFDTYRMAYVSATHEMEKLKNWDKAWEAGVKDMLLKSSYSDEEVMKVVDKESGLRFYQQTAHCL